VSGRGNLIGGRWRPGRGGALVSHDPATGAPVWEGAAAGDEDVAEAVAAARAAHEPWAEAPLEGRIERLERFRVLVEGRRHALAETISRETGKPLWESRAEVDAMLAKVPFSVEGHRLRCAELRRELDEADGVTRFRSHGVVAVLGPFNLPAHLPAAHVVPALVAGNTVVLKPSERAPLVGEKVAELWEAAGLPAGVINLLQGGADTGAALAADRGVDAVLFTGSLRAGLALRRLLVERPETLLALEMGGNNPLVVHEAADPDAAACLTVQSAFLTAGQRCTCARRLIVPEGAGGDAFLARLVARTRALRVGAWTDRPEPFCGPVIDGAAARRVLDAQAELLLRGARALVQAVPAGGARPAMLRPGIVDVTDVAERADEEVFGPLLQVVRTRHFAAAIDEARATAFGLAAGLLSDRAELYDRFRHAVRAGVVNWNRPTTGASGAMPFGGVGRSGNHRPSGLFAADYCSYPAASLETPRVRMPARLPPGMGT
jgi:succinylglutamic semialdehyde dehydrogenase